MCLGITKYCIVGYSFTSLKAQIPYRTSTSQYGSQYGCDVDFYVDRLWEEVWSPQEDTEFQEHHRSTSRDLVHHSTPDTCLLTLSWWPSPLTLLWCHSRLLTDTPHHRELDHTTVPLSTRLVLGDSLEVRLGWDREVDINTRLAAGKGNVCPLWHSVIWRNMNSYQSFNCSS